MIELDDAEKIAEKIVKDIKDNLNNIETEEDAKIQIINRILTECLGWPHKNFKTERLHDNGYSDYILIDNDKPALLIEAKRIGIIKVKTAIIDKVRHLKISGSTLTDAMDGIEQAFSYSSTNGIPITVLTDGIIWIIYKTFIPGENFKSKEAVVFPSLEAIISDFSNFYELLSYKQFNKKLYNSIFDEIHHKRLLLQQELTPPLKESEIKISKKSDIAFDLDRVFTNFFSRLTGDEDEDLLIECFVETRESRIADFSLEKMTTCVLGNISPQEKNVDNELVDLIQTNIKAEDEMNPENHSSSESGQSIFIVGPTGAGKSTFLDRFFRKTLPKPVRRRCVLLRVNCLDATGREDTALEWITETLINSLENEVYKDGVPNWNDLKGLYNSEYVRRSIGSDAKLFKRSEQEFKEKFGEFLSEKVESDREGYLKRIITDVVNNRKKLPIILIDNTDEFSNDYKEKIFQFTQALRRHAHHCLVIFPVTDKSAWSFSKTDMFSIYKSQSFFLPTPSPREVLRKRIDFLKQRLTNENIGKKSKKEYFLGKGIKVSIKNLDGFAQVLENIFVDNDYTSKTIGELTNYNIRRTLALSQRIITSSVLDIEDLISSYLRGKLADTNFSMFVDALMKGDYDAYKQGDNHEIYPIFQVDNEVRQSPLLKLRMLVLLDSIHNHSRTIEEQHLDLQSVVDYFDSIGCPERAVDKATVSLLEAGLIEPYDTSNMELSNKLKLAISYRGIAHLRLASYNSTYVYQMAVTTAITNKDTALEISSIYKSGDLDRAKINSVKKVFINYLIHEDSHHISIESNLEQYNCQKELINNLNKLITSSPDFELVSTLGDEYKVGIFKESVIATVDFYDPEKGFGFVETDGVDSRIFVHAEKFKGLDIESLQDGDDILCDIARDSKGLHVEKIYDVETDITKIETVECNIIRLFVERRYGFVKLLDSERSAFFHITVFSPETRGRIYEGQPLTVEIIPAKKDGEYQVKKIVSFIEDK